MSANAQKKPATLDRKTINTLVSNLKETAEDMGFEVELDGQNVEVDGACGTLTIKRLVIKEPGAQTREEQNWNALAESFGMKKEWLGKTFTDRRSLFKVAGLDRNRPKNCVLITNVRTGKGHICPPGFLIARMPKS